MNTVERACHWCGSKDIEMLNQLEIDGYEAEVCGDQWCYMKMWNLLCTEAGKPEERF